MHSRHFVTLNCNGERRQVHCLRMGEGHPLIALHPSPLSGRFLLPVMEALSSQVTVIAPDTPGYGLSSPLAQPSEDLSGYVEALAAFLDSMELERAAVYGTATGAQIAIEFARSYPERTDFVILDNAATFSDEERHTILKNYFPDLHPREDGVHLAAAWTMARDMYAYFPWYDRRQASRLPGDLPPVAAVNAVARATLEAGPGYSQAYRAAFLNEDATRVQAIRVPATVIRWEGSILKRYTDRFDKLEWPDSIRMLHCGPSQEERLAALRKAVADYAPQGESPPIPRQPADWAGPRRYLASPTAPLHLLEGGEGKGVPLLVLHDLGQSAASALTELAPGYLEGRPFGLVDLPGHGASAAPPPPHGPKEHAQVLAAALKEWQAGKKIELLGIRAGGVIAAALAQQMPGRVQRVLLEGMPDGNLDLDAYQLPDLTPRWDGGHWLAAWQYVGKGLGVGEANSPGILRRRQQKTLDLMASLAVYESSLEQYRSYSLAAVLSALSVPVEHIA